MSEGVTDSEQFVDQICQKSFMSLWSYVNPKGRDPAKELCDVLCWHLAGVCGRIS